MIKLKKILVILILFLCNYINTFADEYELYNKTEIKTDVTPECSGMAISTLNFGIVWGANDSGGRPSIYAIDIQTGELIAEVYLKNISNLDFEELALIENPQKKGEFLIYIFDTGDNFLLRGMSYIYIIKEPKLDLSIKEQYILIHHDNYESIKVNYSNRNHDIEGVFVEPDNRNIYFISKETDLAEVFILPYPYNKGSTNTAEFYCTLSDEVNHITSADINKNASQLIIKNINNVYIYDNSENDFLATLQTAPRKIQAYKKEPQGESIAFAPNGSDFYTISEIVSNEKQYLYHYKLKSNYVNSYSPIKKNKNITITIKKNNIKISIKSKKIEPYTIVIYDINGKKIKEFSEGYLLEGKNHYSYQMPDINGKIVIIHININGIVYVKKLIV